tara:strand:+ start:814 stop:1596 length:783 start_codon:yes stop_codon:yes gene_type:complete
MGNKLEKELLDELKRFVQINHNLANLTEQNMATNNGSGFLNDQGQSNQLKKFVNRQKEMAEQEVEDIELDMSTDPEAEVEDVELDIATDPEGEVEDVDLDIPTGEDEIVDTEIDSEVVDDADSTELDVTDLVAKQDEVSDELTDQKDILSKNTQSLDDLMGKLTDLESHLSSMDNMVSKIEDLEGKLEEFRPKTEEEKLGLRKHDSGPYNRTLSDFFTDKEEVFDKTGKKQYILTKDAVEDFSDIDIEKSFTDPEEEEEN